MRTVADGGKLPGTSFRVRVSEAAVSEVGYPVPTPTQSAKGGASPAHDGTGREFAAHVQLRASVRCRSRVGWNPSTGQLRGPGCHRTGDGDGIVKDCIVKDCIARERRCLSDEALA